MPAVNTGREQRIVHLSSISFQKNRYFILKKPTRNGALAPQATTISSIASVHLAHEIPT
jgi:hypothetical protein